MYAGAVAARAAMQSESSQRLFVYGTLCRGEANHELLTGSRFVGEAETASGFQLIDLGPFPGLIFGGRQRVIGELYLVTAEVVARLDHLEDHPNYYTRQVIDLSDGTKAEAYVLRSEHAATHPIISHGSWLAHNRSRLGGR